MPFRFTGRVMWEPWAGPRLRWLWSLGFRLAVSRYWFYETIKCVLQEKQGSDPLLVFTTCIGLFASAVAGLVLTDTRKLFLTHCFALSYERAMFEIYNYNWDPGSIYLLGSNQQIDPRFYLICTAASSCSCSEEMTVGSWY